MESNELQRRMEREHRRTIADVCLVSLLIVASGVIPAIFLFHSFPALKGILIIIPVAVITFKYFPRPEKTIRQTSTRGLIDVHAVADREQRRRLVDELCDRAKGRDRMAKAFLYGRDWEAEEDGAGRRAQRNSWEGNAFRLPKIDGLVVLDDQGRFRTVMSASTLRVRKMLVWHVLWLLLCCVALDLGRSLEPSNPHLARVLHGIGFIGLPLSGFIPIFASSRPYRVLDGLSVNQVLFVFVHSRGGLMDEAGEWLRRRGSWDPEARRVATRLGLMEEKAESEPKRAGADHV